MAGIRTPDLEPPGGRHLNNWAITGMLLFNYIMTIYIRGKVGTYQKFSLLKCRPNKLRLFKIAKYDIIACRVDVVNRVVNRDVHTTGTSTEVMIAMQMKLLSLCTLLIIISQF